MIKFYNIQSFNNEQLPCPRWGHSIITISNQIYLFGGYQNSNYYNDLWRFDLNRLIFQKINQQGDIPPPCSNFTMNYYSKNNTLLLFGGGTINKEKLNAIYQLDMNNYRWIKRNFKESMSIPWQRSYHCSEIIDHYLIMYGGEFLHDLDDTWILDLNSNQWKQIKLTSKPKGRKFASSFIHNNKFYIIGGCYGKYECVNSIYSMDFNAFLMNDDIKQLQWKQVQLTNKQLIIRWGHISIVKDNKAYIYGGRHQNKDIQNLIQIDLLTFICKEINIKGIIPKGRRKPGICIQNNNLFCFSGFDGNYVKDFIYCQLPINLEIVEIKQDKEGKQKLERIISLNNVEEEQINFDDEVLYLTEEQFQRAQVELCNKKYKESLDIKDINYEILRSKLIAKSTFFKNFFNKSYAKTEFIMKYDENTQNNQRKIIQKMFFSYFHFGKVLVQRCEFKNSKKYFKQLLDVAEYYCCNELIQICRKQLLKFFTDEIVSQKSNLLNLIQVTEIVSSINKQYQDYAGFYLLKKLIQKHRSYINSISDLKQNILNSRQFKRNEWILKMIDKHHFQLSQQILCKKDMDFQNENSINIPHKQEILYEKTRKGSMHNRHINI